MTDIVVVADAGILSEANQIALKASGLSFILGTKIPFVPDVVRKWRDKHFDRDIADGQILVQPWPATSSEKTRCIPYRVVYYQHRADRARRTLRGIAEQVSKAEKAVDGKVPVKRNRFIKLSGATKSVNRELGTKARGLPGLKGYTTNLVEQTPGLRHRRRPPALVHREELPDVQARAAGPPIYHHKRESIDAHLWPSCSPPWPSATTSRPKPAGEPPVSICMAGPVLAGRIGVAVLVGCDS